MAWKIILNQKSPFEPPRIFELSNRASGFRWLYDSDDRDDAFFEKAAYSAGFSELPILDTTGSGNHRAKQS